MNTTKGIKCTFPAFPHNRIEPAPKQNLLPKTNSNDTCKNKTDAIYTAFTHILLF